MTDFVTVPGGTRIALDRAGTGPAVLLVGGALQFRATDPATGTLVDELAGRGLTAVHYDRPGRGESTGEAPDGLGGEVEALRALVAAVGGRAAVYGSSSGAAIALAAAVEVPGITDLVLWEPPFGPEGGTQGAEAVARMRDVLATGDPEQVVRTFMHGMPPQWFDQIRAGADWPLYAAMAPTLLADAEALAWAEQAPRAGRWAGVPAGATVLVGAGAFDFLRAAAEEVAAALPAGRLRAFAGDGHSWAPADLADQIAAALH